MNFSNENLLIIIVLISIVIMFLTSDSICKNKEQFAPLVDFSCDCLHVTTGGCTRVKCLKTECGCIFGYRIKCNPIRTNWCGKKLKEFKMLRYKTFNK